MEKSKLAIAIPTYNRPEILKENLLIMLPEIMKYNITVYISDDSNNYLTRDMISDLKLQYDRIQYYKNEPSLGHDKNCLKTLKMPTEEYIWYLGDSRYIIENGIKEVLDIIEEKKVDFVLVRTERAVDITTQTYYDANKFFVDLAWHATTTGATIYKNELLFKNNYDKYINSNFMQLGILLEEMLESKNGLHWINKTLVLEKLDKGGSYWINNIFEVFVEDWFNFVHNLPNKYSEKNKIKVIKSHSDHTSIFKLRSYLVLRNKNILNLKSYLKYYSKLKFTSSLNVYIVFAISLIPRFILSTLHDMKKKNKG